MMALLIEAAARSFALGLLVWIAMIAIRPGNPHLQKTVWLTVLLASLAMPLVLAWRVVPSIDAPDYLLSIAATQGAGSARADLSSLIDAFAARMPVSATVIATVYVIVTLALLLRFASGFLRLARIRREATPFPAVLAGRFDVRITPKMMSPATFGSTILLPTDMRDWSEAKLAAVLSHEKSHVLHRDCHVQWLARLHACIFWFNPLAWWLHRRLAELAETTSDDAVIQAFADRAAYADMLLDIARKPAPTQVVTSIARGNLSARIERIISNVPPAAQPRRWVRGTAVAMLLPAFAMAATNLQRPQSPAELSDAPPAADARSAVMPPMIEGLSDLEQYYPIKAERMGRESLVVVEVDMDAQGNATAARVAHIDPADEEWGFGPAAIAVAQKGRYDNRTGKPTTFRMRVKFDLK